MGLAVPGNRTIYVKDIYGSDVVKEGDVLTDRNSNQWKIVTIIKEPFLNRTEIYKKAVIKVWFGGFKLSEADVIKDDLNNLLLEQGDVFSVETSTEEIDGMGNVTSVTSFTIQDLWLPNGHQQERPKSSRYGTRSTW